MAGRAAPAVPPEREDVAQQVESWRRDVLREAGYPPEMADAIAKAPADLHRAVDLLRQGCPAELAVRILA